MDSRGFCRRLRADVHDHAVVAVLLPLTNMTCGDELAVTIDLGEVPMERGHSHGHVLELNGDPIDGRSAKKTLDTQPRIQRASPPLR
jgi:F0F1-type ATP synthase alpha subunit